MNCIYIDGFADALLSNVRSRLPTSSRLYYATRVHKILGKRYQHEAAYEERQLQYHLYQHPAIGHFHKVLSRITHNLGLPFPRLPVALIRGDMPADVSAALKLIGEQFVVHLMPVGEEIDDRAEEDQLTDWPGDTVEEVGALERGDDIENLCSSHTPEHGFMRALDHLTEDYVVKARHEAMEYIKAKLQHETAMVTDSQT